jgi:adenine-specific DNA glycosylase
VLAVRRPEGGLVAGAREGAESRILAGLWELPGSARRGDSEPEQSLREHVEQRLGLSIRGVEQVGELQHIFTHIRLRLRVFSCNVGEQRVRRDGYPEHRWLSPGGFAKLPQATVTRKAASLACPQAR